MRMLLVAATALVGTIGLSGPASAGIYADDLSRCIVKSASGPDQVVLIRWVFGAMASHDAVKPLSAVSESEHVELNRTGAAMFQRLVLEDCRQEAIAAQKYEGEAAIAGSFQILGQVAMRGLMTDPKVAAAMQGLAGFIDKPRWESFVKEAGAPAK